jgi:hypothetical protein
MNYKAVTNSERTVTEKSRSNKFIDYYEKSKRKMFLVSERNIL